MDGAAFDRLVEAHLRLYEEYGRHGARPSPSLIGFQGMGPVVSVSFPYVSCDDLVERLAAGALAVSGLGADEAYFSVGDEMAIAVLNPSDLPTGTDGWAAAVMVVGEAGGPRRARRARGAALPRSRGVVWPYWYDDIDGQTTWAKPVPLMRSLTDSVWAHSIVPLCFDRSVNRQDALDLNAALGNDVEILRAQPVRPMPMAIGTTSSGVVGPVCFEARVSASSPWAGGSWRRLANLRAARPIRSTWRRIFSRASSASGVRPSRASMLQWRNSTGTRIWS
jgi:hypothetical protein